MQEMISKLKDMGLNLMPLQKLSKFPIQGVSWERLQHEKYDGEFPEGHNVAVICGEISGNLFVVDLDDKSLFESFKEFDTFTVKTGKGYHKYFKTHGFLPPNRKFDDYRFRHIDLKSEGGYVLAPGSIHPDTKKPYEIINDKPIMFIDAKTILEKLEELGFNIQKKTFEEISKGVSEGGRNDSTFKYACYLIREKGLYGEALRKEIDELNKRHKPPLPQNEIDIIINQALGYESHNIKKSDKIKSLENLKEEIKKLPESIIELNIAERFPEYVRELGEDTVIEVLQDSGFKDISVKNIKKISVCNIRAEHEGTRLEFNAMIIAVGERTSYTKSADFSCPGCGATKHIESDVYHIFSDTPYCKKCKKNYKINLDSREIVYLQSLRLQEFLEDARSSSPVEFDAEITDDNVGEAFISERKTFIGTPRNIPEKSNGREFNKIVIEIEEMKDLDQREGCMPSGEEIDKWKSDPRIFEKVRDSIGPEIYINPKVKESLMLAVIGGTSLNEKRGNIHVGIVGDAQTGKSDTFVAFHKVVPGIGYSVGKHATAAGLTISMVRLYNGTSIPQAGLLPLHTGKPVIIDEGDKMKPDDLDALLECMEQERVTITKSGTGKPGLSLPASCPILFGGNPKGGKFNDNYKNIMDNVNLSTPFVSRFDILWFLKDKNDPKEDEIIRKIIRNFENNKEEYMTKGEIQRYFTYTRTLEAKVPKEIFDKVDELHKRIRVANKELVGLSIGWRQYYGIHRLITASAAAHLREEVIEEDFKIVEDILRDSFRTLGINIDTGEVKDTFEKKGDKRKRIFKETWGECMDENGTVDEVEFIESLSQKDPFNKTVNDAQDEFNKLKNGGYIIIQDERCRLESHG